MTVRMEWLNQTLWSFLQLPQSVWDFSCNDFKAGINPPRAFFFCICEHSKMRMIHLTQKNYFTTSLSMITPFSCICTELLEKLVCMCVISLTLQTKLRQFV